MDVVTLGAALSIMKKMPDTAASSAAAAEDAADRAEEAARILTIDDTLSESGQAADSKAVGDALAEKLDVADLPDTASNANQLLSEKYTVDIEPYQLRPSGGQGADREFDTIVGGSIVWNQLIQNGDFSDGTSHWSASEIEISISAANEELTVTIVSPDSSFYKNSPSTSAYMIPNHIYVFSYDLYTSKAGRAAKYNIGNAFYAMKNVSVGWNTLQSVMKTTFTTEGNKNLRFGIVYALVDGFEANDAYKIKNVQIFDLTAMFGSEIADHIYELEQAEAGAGVAWFRKYFPNDYYNYNPGELMHVSGVSAHKTYDADESVIGNYPLDSSLTLRGIPKLVDGKLSFDGDIYKPDGTVERLYGTRAYESGDESLSNAITDGTNTVYKLTTPTTEQAQSFQSPQVLDPYGTEEYVTTSPVPVGHETKYPENLRAKIEGLPWNFASLIAPVEAKFEATRNYTSGSLFIVNNTLYKATANIANGGTITPNTNCTATTLAEIIAAL